MIPRVTLRKALSDQSLLGASLSGDTWHAWRTLLLAIMGEPLDEADLQTFKKLTGRDSAPTERVEEFLGVIGRRGGKSRALGVLAAYIAGLCDHSAELAKGERGVVLLIAPDQRQSRILLDYVEGSLRSTPLLAQLIVSRTQETLSLNNGIDIEVRAASFRRLRGLSCVGIIADEAAFFSSDETSANADTEILAAARPSLATTGGPLIIISSPYARRGEVWEIYRRHFGSAGDPLVLVAQATSRDMNPTLLERVVERALERDPSAARAEYLAEFRTDIESYVSREIADAAVDEGVFERPPIDAVNYRGFCDPSGGASDSMTLGISHIEKRMLVLDAIRERKAPFSPDDVVAEFSDLLKSYRVHTVRGDRYGGSWPAESFRRHGINYVAADQTKNEIYQAFLPELNSRNIQMLDHPRMISQLTGLERRTTRGGRDVIDHPPSGKDDLINAAAGALLLVKPAAVSVAVDIGLVQIGAGRADPMGDFYEGDSFNANTGKHSSA